MTIFELTLKGRWCDFDRGFQNFATSEPPTTKSFTQEVNVANLSLIYPKYPNSSIPVESTCQYLKTFRSLKFKRS